MRRTKRLAAIGLAAMTAATVAVSGSASAAFPNFTDCPRSQVLTCVNIQSTSGSMTIKGFAVPLGDSLEIRGGLGLVGDQWRFYPPRGTDGFFARPVQVPGGILGIDLPISANEVEATARLAGPPESLRVDPNDLSLRMPLKLTLSNPLIGPACRIGTDSSPAWVTLITGTTNPPAPNRPISGHIGEVTFPDGNTFLFRGNRNVDNSFAIPGASYCGLGLGLINTVINAKLRLPSASGNNTLIVDNNVGLQNAVLG